MKQSEFFIKTFKEAPRDEVALNASLLARAGFIHKIGAGIYTFLPLGLRVIQQIQRIARQEMNAIGGQELLMPALHPKEYWQTTGRWETFDALYRLKAHEDREYGLGPTHEEIVVPVAKSLIQSYKELPLYLYQIQTKFRDEPRAKSGILRGREFIMKDLYSFHATQDDLERYYEIVAASYKALFARMGLDAIRTKASGGTFSPFSDEYQVVTPAGEDTIFFCKHCKNVWNAELVGKSQQCPECKKSMEQQKAAEVGNIFKLGTKFSDAFDLSYQTEKGERQRVLMGCYGIGISRVCGVISEIHHDEKGLIWPDEVAPFAVHLVKLTLKNETFPTQVLNFYKELQSQGVEVLYDDRKDMGDGAKLVESDLIGIPWRVIASQRTLEQHKVEVKRRNEKESSLLSFPQFLALLHESNRH